MSKSMVAEEQSGQATLGNHEPRTTVSKIRLVEDKRDDLLSNYRRLALSF